MAAAGGKCIGPAPRVERWMPLMRRPGPIDGSPAAVRRPYDTALERDAAQPVLAAAIPVRADRGAVTGVPATARGPSEHGQGEVPRSTVGAWRTGRVASRSASARRRAAAS